MGEKQAAVLIRDTGKCCLSDLLLSLLLPPFCRQMRYPRRTQRRRASSIINGRCFVLFNAVVLISLFSRDELFLLPSLGSLFPPPFFDLPPIHYFFPPTGMMLLLPPGALLTRAQVSQAGTKGHPLPEPLPRRE